MPPIFQPLTKTHQWWADHEIINQLGEFPSPLIGRQSEPSCSYLLWWVLKKPNALYVRMRLAT